MHTIINMIPTEISTALGWTVIHSIWQAALLSLVMWGLLSLKSVEKGRSRYLIALLTLLSIMACGVATFCFYLGTSSAAEAGLVVPTIQAWMGEVIPLQEERSFFSWVQQQTHIISGLWMLGVLMLILRLGISLGYLRYIRGTAVALGETPVAMDMQRLAHDMGVGKTVRLYASKHTTVPMTMGYLKPIIFFPIGMVTHLSSEEIEAVLIHELAHIRRNDYLHNILISVMEALFFYHPAVWWVSATIRSERENACDDIAVHHLSDPVRYARALVAIEQMRQHASPALAMAIFSDKKILRHRISRILNLKQNRRDMKEKMIAVMLIISGVFFAAAKSHDMVSLIKGEPLNTMLDTHTDQETDDSADVPSIEREEVARANAIEDLSPAPRRLWSTPAVPRVDTLPRVKRSSRQHVSMKVITDVDGKQVEIDKENGDITSIKVDGKEIPEESYGEYEDVIREVEGDSHISIHLDGDRWDFGDHDVEMWMGNLDSIIEGSIGRIEEIDISRFEDHFEELGERFEDIDMEQFFGEGEQFDELMRSLRIEMDSLGTRIHRFDFDDRFEDFPFEVWGDTEDITILGGGSNTVADRFASELNRDGLLTPHKSNKVEISGKSLKINGEKMPSPIYNKYKDIYQEVTGAALTRKSKMVFELEGKPRKRQLRTF